MKKKKQFSIKVDPISSFESGRGVRIDENRVSEIKSEILRLMNDDISQVRIRKALNISHARMSRWSREVVLSEEGPTHLLKYNDKTFAQILFDRIEFSSPNDCWKWRGFIKPNGYGSINYKSKAHQAHRAVYECFYYSVPVGKELDHKCENRWCVNPRHLQPVSNVKNKALAIARKYSREQK